MARAKKPAAAPEAEKPSGLRYFTVAEANALLPEVRRLLTEIRRAVAGLEELRPRLLGEDGEVRKPEPDTLVDSSHLMLVTLFHRALARFQELGIEVKDVGRGLVDFPARKGNVELRLCWLDGEDSIGHFHDLESGFAGRRPIEEMDAAEIVHATPPDDEEE